jgi:hypothetical protein
VNVRPGAYQQRQTRPRNRFGHFDVLGQAGHWDQVTADLVTSRMGSPPARVVAVGYRDAASSS